MPLTPEFLQTWRLFDLTPIRDAAGLLFCSTAKVYDLGKRGHLTIVRTANNRTFVRTPGLARLIDGAPELSAQTRDPRPDAAHAARRKRADSKFNQQINVTE